MISRVFVILLTAATANSFNYERAPRLAKNKTIDYRVSLAQILKLSEVNRPPFNSLKSREDFVKLAEQHIKNRKPYNYKQYRPYNPSKPVFIYDKDYVSKVLSSLDLLLPLQNVPIKPRNTTESAIVTDFNIKVTSSTESAKPLNNSFLSTESYGIETTTTNYSGEDVNTTTNSYSEEETFLTPFVNSSTSLTEDKKGKTEQTTESFWFATNTAGTTDILNYSTTEPVTVSYGVENTTDIIEGIDTTTTLAPNIEDFSTDSFGIITTTDVLSYLSTEPTTSPESPYVFRESNLVATTTTTNTEEVFIPTTESHTEQTTYAAVSTIKEENFPESNDVDVEKITEQTTERFWTTTSTVDGTDILNYSTTESATVSYGVETTTDIIEGIDTTTTLAPNIEDFSTDGFGIITTTDVLSYLSTEPTTSSESPYVFRESNLVATTTTTNTKEVFIPTTESHTEQTTYAAVSTIKEENFPESNDVDVEKITEQTTERFWTTTSTVDGTDILNYSTTESATVAYGVETTTDIMEGIDTTTTLAPNIEDFSTDGFGIITTTDVLSYLSTEPTTSSESPYVFRESNLVATTTTTNTKEVFIPTTESHTEQTTYAAVSTIKEENFPESNDVDVEKITEQTTERFWTTTSTVDGTDILNYSTTESATVSYGVETTTDIIEGIDTTTTLAPNIEDFSTDGFGIITTTDVLSYFSTEPTTNPESPYELTVSNLVETTTPINTEEAFNPTTESHTEQTTYAAVSTIKEENFPESNDVDVEKITEQTTERFWTTTSTVDEIDILNYSTTESVTSANILYTTEFPTTLNIEPDNGHLVFTGSNRVENTTATNAKKDINITMDSYTEQTIDGSTTLASNLTEETVTELSMEKWSYIGSTPVDKDGVLNYSTKKSVTSAETLYTTEIPTTVHIEPESNRIESTTATNAEEYISTTTDSYTDSSTTLTSNLANTPVTELIMESWTGIETTTDNEADVRNYSTTKSVTSAEILYTTEIPTTVNIESENGDFVFTESDQTETTTAINTEKGINTTTDNYTEHTSDTSIYKYLAPNPTEKSWVGIGVSTVNGTDILNYSTAESVTSADTLHTTEIFSTVNKEPDNGDFVFTVETTTATYADEGINTITDSYTEQTIDSFTTLASNPTEDQVTERSMEESWNNIGTIRVDRTDILNFSTTESVIIPSTLNASDTMTFTIDSIKPVNSDILPAETNRVETATTTNEDNGSNVATIDCEDEIIINPEVIAQGSDNYTTLNLLNKEVITKSTTMGFDSEASEMYKQATETDSIPERIVQSEPVTAENFDSIISVTEATQIIPTFESIAISQVNATNEQQPIVFSTLNNLNLEDSIQSSTGISKETVSLTNLLQPINESYNQFSTQAFNLSRYKQTTESTTSFVNELFGRSMTSPLKDITEVVKVTATSAQNPLTPITTEYPSLSTSGRNYEIPTEPSEMEIISEIMEQAEDTSTKPTTTATSSDDYPTTTIPTIIKVNTDEEKTAIENKSIQQPTVIAEHLINIKSNTVDNKPNENNSPSSSDHLENIENPTIEPLFYRQQKLGNENHKKESSKRKPKKYNYATDVMPTLGDYDYDY